MHIPLMPKWPVDVRVFQKRGDSWLSYTTKARFIKKGIEEFYQLKAGKVKLRPPSYNYMVTQTNGRPYVELFEYARNMFTPVERSSLELIYERDINGDVVMEDYEDADGIVKKRPKVNKVIGLKAADEDMSQWGATFRYQQEQKFKQKSWLEKYMPFIYLILLTMFCMVMAYIFMQSMAETGNKFLQGVAQLNRQALPAGA